MDQRRGEGQSKCESKRVWHHERHAMGDPHPLCDTPRISHLPMIKNCHSFSASPFMRVSFRSVTAVAVISAFASIATAQTFVLVQDNGPFVNQPGQGFNGADVSQTETGTVVSLGFNANAASLPRVADDFIIAAAPLTTRLARLNFYATQTQSTNFTTNVNFGALYIQIFDQDPRNGVPPIAGDFTTNRLLSSAWSGAYRVGTSSNPTDWLVQNRPITRLTADMTWLPRLAPGTYWMLISAVGDTALATSPNPQTILVTPRLPDSNGLQQSGGNWFNTADYPFQLFAACPGDFNASGSVSVQDIFDFLTAWFANDPSSDVNATAGTSVQDIFDFLGAWFLTC